MFAAGVRVVEIVLFSSLYFHIWRGLVGCFCKNQHASMFVVTSFLYLTKCGVL